MWHPGDGTACLLSGISVFGQTANGNYFLWGVWDIFWHDGSKLMVRNEYKKEKKKKNTHFPANKCSNPLALCGSCHSARQQQRQRPSRWHLASHTLSHWRETLCRRSHKGVVLLPYQCLDFTPPSPTTTTTTTTNHHSLLDVAAVYMSSCLSADLNVHPLPSHVSAGGHDRRQWNVRRSARPEPSARPPPDPPQFKKTKTWQRD